jgi:hypothetical protein
VCIEPSYNETNKADINMLTTIYRFMDYIKFGLSKIFEIPNILRRLYNDFLHHLTLIKHNLKNLREANITLAHYHMELGNLNDVILRCFIITKFIDSEDLEAYNLAALAYYLKGNIDKARKNLILAKNVADPTLEEFIQTPNTDIERIPLKIFAKYRDCNIDNYIEDKKGLYNGLSQKLIDLLFENIDEINENLKILDLNPAAEAIADSVHSRIGGDFEITAADCSDMMRKYLSTNKSAYNKAQDYETFASDPKGKYDAIFSMLGLEYIKNISEPMLDIKKVVKRNTLIGLVFRASNNGKTYLNKEKNAFIYGEDFLKEQLDIADFEIISIKETVVSANKYIFVICAKKKE